jgi:hypothetical protein
MSAIVSYNPRMDIQRRLLLGGALGAGGLLLASRAFGATPTFVPDPIPPIPSVPRPGKAGDFAFLTGEWRIHHRQPGKEGTGWIEFDGEATVYSILGGIGSVEELRIPSRGFSGMGLRLLDVEKKIWADHWVNARSGVLTAPGVQGSFENGAGIFVQDEEENGKPVKWIGVWDLITPASCRWRQAVSRDAGRTWTQTWIMDWRRA